jgi:hypothetical protein
VSETTIPVKGSIFSGKFDGPYTTGVGVKVGVGVSVTVGVKVGVVESVGTGLGVALFTTGCIVGMTVSGGLF